MARRTNANVREVYTTGQAARVLRVSQSHVRRCLERGDLKGYRVYTGGVKDGRWHVRHEALVRFARVYGVPLCFDGEGAIP